MASAPPILTDADIQRMDAPAPMSLQGRPRQPAPRTPEQIRIDQGRAAAAPLDVPSAQANINRTNQQIRQNDTRGINYQDEQSLRGQYQGLPAVQNYQTVAPMVQRALSAGPGGAGDLNIVYAFAKVMDPGSVVRESEVQMSQNTGSLGEQINGWVRSLRNGGRLDPNVRRRLLNEIQGSAVPLRSAYQQARKQYWRDAEDYGFDPERIVGGDIDEAYQSGPNAPAQEAASDGDPAMDMMIQALRSITSGSGGGPPEGSPERFRMLEWLHNRREQDRREGNADVRLGVVPGGDGLQNDPNGPTEFVGRYGTTEEQERQLEEEYQRSLPAQRAREEREQWVNENPVLGNLDTAVRSGANALTLGWADRAAGGDPFMVGANPEGVQFQHGVTASDWENRPLQALGGTLAGGSVLPYGATLGRQIAMGGAYGGLTDFNNTEGSFLDRIGAAGRGTLVGGGTNAGVGLMGRMWRSPNAQAIEEAGARQDVSVPRFMTGRESTQVANTAVGATMGRIPMARAAGRVTEGLEAARNRAANEIGNVGDNYSAGRAAQRGARTWLRESADRADEMFRRIPIRPETPAQLTNTRQALGEMTEGLTSNPELSGLLEDRRLIQFRDALENGGLSWADQRRFRSLIGEMIGQPQVAGEVTSRAALRRLYGALTDDMQATAQAQGPRALTMFNRANQYYRGREARREGIISDILGADGNAAPEDTFRMINRWAQRDVGDVNALRQTMRSLPADDANAVRATIFARMGRATRGQQDETGEVFSPFTFASQWAQLEPRAKALLVPNAAHRRNLEDIALLASAMRRSENMSNTSRSGLAILSGNMLVGANSVWAHPVLTAMGVGGGLMAGRMLASPSGSRTLLRALRNPESFRGLVPQQDDQDSTAPAAAVAP